ncbi:MAG: hypothetical protein E7I11_07090 [Klebsiella michiganensis]|nr:hypothetical protein [Klebsiella michiganensis]
MLYRYAVFSRKHNTFHILLLFTIYMAAGADGDLSANFFPLAKGLSVTQQNR